MKKFIKNEESAVAFELLVCPLLTEILVTHLTSLYLF